MAFVWRRSAKSLLVTSGANTFGMLSNTNSSLMPISSFGYFAFIVIPINYVFIVFYFPACMMFYELYVREKEEYIGENILSFNAFSKCFKSIRNCSAIKKLCLKFL
jgi:predicted metal-binding transcription factor (methanogenesis marker protein 9)